MDKEVPISPVHTGATDTGFSCMTALRREGARYTLSSSKSLTVFPLLMFFIAIIICFIPWEVSTDIGIKLKHVIAIGLAWGGLCAFAASLFKRVFGRSVVFDVTRNNVTIYKGKQAVKELTFEDLVCFQLCFQDDDRYKSYELNLCGNKNSIITRDCILAYCREKYVRKVVKELSIYTSTEIVDCIEANKAHPVG